MSKSIAQLFHVKEKKVHIPSGNTFTHTAIYTGVEVECERATWVKGGRVRPRDMHLSEQCPDLINTGWTLKDDGSLVDGAEFVFTEPLLGEDVAIALRSLSEHTVMPTSPRASMHVHVDWSGVTTTYSLASLAAILYCIEPAIFAMVGEGRKNNNYCRPLAVIPMDNLVSLFIEGGEIMTTTRYLDGAIASNNKEYRYFGANFVSLSSFGTVEFRYFPSPTSLQDMIVWVELCHCLRAAALRLASMGADILHYLSDPSHIEELIRDTFPKYDIADVLMRNLDIEDSAERMRVMALMCAAKLSKPQRRMTQTDSKSIKKYLIKAVTSERDKRTLTAHYDLKRASTGTVDEAFIEAVRNSLTNPTV